MDVSERAQLKRLAIDTIVASSVHSEAAKLAEALESALDELDKHDTAPHCRSCHCPLPGSVEIVTYSGREL